MKTLFSTIKKLLTSEEKKEEDKIDYPRLIKVANTAIWHLLNVTALTGAEQKILSRLSNFLHSYTDNQSSPNLCSKYCNDFKYASCSYKIARELVLRFTAGNSFGDLSWWANVYYWDNVLCNHAYEQMAKINPIKGMAYAIEHPRADSFQSEEQMCWMWWQRLKQQPGITFGAIKNILISSIMDFRVQKDCAKFILKNGLLSGDGSEEYYTYFIEHVILPAKNYEQRMLLSDKERNNLIAIARKK